MRVLRIRSRRGRPRRHRSARRRGQNGPRHKVALCAAFGRTRAAVRAPRRITDTMPVPGSAAWVRGRERRTPRRSSGSKSGEQDKRVASRERQLVDRPGAMALDTSGGARHARASAGICRRSVLAGAKTPTPAAVARASVCIVLEVMQDSWPAAIRPHCGPLCAALGR